MDIDAEIFSLINYYVRLNLYGSAVRLCDESLRRIKDDRQLNVLKGYCLAKTGRAAEAIRLLNNYIDERDLDLAIYTALKIAYSNESAVDRDSVNETEMKIQSVWAKSHDKAAFLAGTLEMFEKAFDRARPLIERTANSNSHNTACISQKGWLEVLSGRDLRVALQHFDAAIATDKCPEGYLGKSRVLEMRQSAAEMKAVINELIDIHPTLLAGYIELMKALASGREWEQLAEAAQNAALIQNESIPVQLYESLETVVVRGNSEQTESILSELFDTVSKLEPTNHDLCLYISKFLGAVTLDNPIVLQFAKRFVEKALATKNSTEAIGQKSKLLFLSGDMKASERAAISAVEEQNLSAPDPLIWVIRCYIAQKNFAEAKTQMEFLKLTFVGIETSPEYFFLETLILRSQNLRNEHFLSNLRNVVDHHLARSLGIPYGIEYLKELDGTFLLEIAAHLFEIAPLSPSKLVDPSLKEIERILAVVCDNFPGAAKPTFLLARTKYLCAENDAAQSLLQSCIDKNNNIAEAHLLLAQIYVQKQNLEEASKCLDLGLGFNFKVRDHPLFYLVKARLLKRSRKSDDAVMMLKSALDLPAFVDREKSLDKLEVTEADRISIYLELIDLLQQLGQPSEADRIMEAAIETYKGKPEANQLGMMNAQLRLQGGDIDGALRILDAVSPDQNNYQIARMRMGQIYLEYKHDRLKFAKCYQDILDKNPTPEAYVLLGDAYMSIQEPTNAIDAYETAMRRNPKDFELAVKIGDAYVKCHLYTKAINFYESAMNTSKQPLLRRRFAEQLLKMGNYEKCERVLRDVIDEGKEPSDSELRHHVEFWALLSKMHYQQGNHGPAITAQQRARALQMKLLSTPPPDVTDISAERRIAAELCSRLAELHSSRREWAKAVDLYKETIFISERDIRFSPNPPRDSLEYFHLQTMTKLAHIYMQMGKFQQCSQQCQSMLTLDRNNNDAILMLADLTYQQNEGEQALKHFAQLLERNPTRYIELGWRKGDLEQVEKYVKAAVEANPRATVDAGYNYCRGLIEWYSGEPNAALQVFNRARRDLEWGESALYNMVEICMNPDNEIIGGEVMFDQSEEIQLGENRETGVKAAARLLSELKHKPGLDYKFKLMENFLLLSSGNKANVQLALNNFLDIVGADVGIGSAEPEKNVNVGAILGSARAFMVLKQTQKAKVQLKRVLAVTWNLEDADYLEQCWLLLADIYINQGKSEQATTVLRTVLQYNASAARAFEYMGFLKEREQKYADAAANYEMAWRLCRQRNPSVGYKLAYNYLKCFRLFECIDACHVVLKLNPNYPKIRKEILDKARTNIRT